MENASKALIIAGAILISILLISVGIIIMNAINDPVQQGASAADSQAIEMFNSKFVSYQGTVKGSALKSLVSTINSSNAVEEDHTVGFTTSIDGITSINGIKANKDYEVNVYYYDGSTKAYKGTKAKFAGPDKDDIKSEKGYIFEIEISKAL